MKKIFYAVLHIPSADRFKDVSVLCTKVTNALIKNALVYTAPDPTTADLGDEGGLLIIYIANADSKKTRARRDKQSRKVFKLLQRELRYVNNISDGDKDKETGEIIAVEVFVASHIRFIKLIRIKKINYIHK